MDSELHLTCRCKTDPCVCQQFCTPLKCEFRGNTKNVTLLEHIVQRKGEAQMALLDWLISVQDDIKEREAENIKHSWVMLRLMCMHKSEVMPKTLLSFIQC